MNLFNILIFSIVTFSNICAQEVISTQGDSYSNTNGAIDFTIGEAIIHTETSGTLDITQGFHQTNMKLARLENSPNPIDVTVFPNPAQDFLTIQVDSGENFTYNLFDSNGKLIAKNKLTAKRTKIEISDLPVGAYTLNLNDDVQNLKSLKVLKVR